MTIKDAYGNIFDFNWYAGHEDNNWYAGQRNKKDDLVQLVKDDCFITLNLSAAKELIKLLQEYVDDQESDND